MYLFIPDFHPYEIGNKDNIISKSIRLNIYLKIVLINGAYYCIILKI